MTELGTTYIKLGQMLSTRPDLVGPTIAEELTKLQGDTPADSPEVVRATLETELGQPVEALYTGFEFHALGSASIGQVHRAVLPDGRIGVLDCGMVGRLDDRTRVQLEDLAITFAARDIEGLVDTILDLCTVPPDFDRRAFTVEVNHFIADYLDVPISEIDFSAMTNTMISVVYQFHLTVPPNIILLFKTIALLEGTARMLDPDFDLYELVKPYLAKIVQRRFAPELLLRRVARGYRDCERLLIALPREVNSVLEKMQQGTLDVQFYVRGLDRVVNRLIDGIVVAALVVGSAILWSTDVSPTFKGISLLGTLGIILAFFLIARLLWAIEKSGKL